MLKKLDTHFRNTPGGAFCCVAGRLACWLAPPPPPCGIQKPTSRTMFLFHPSAKRDATAAGTPSSIGSSQSLQRGMPPVPQAQQTHGTQLFSQTLATGQADYHSLAEPMNRDRSSQGRSDEGTRQHESDKVPGNRWNQRQQSFWSLGWSSDTPLPHGTGLPAAKGGSSWDRSSELGRLSGDSNLHPVQPVPHGHQEGAQDVDSFMRRRRRFSFAMASAIKSSTRVQTDFSNSTNDPYRHSRTGTSTGTGTSTSK